MPSGTDALQERRTHHIYWRFAIKPNGKRQRALMQQHRQAIRAARAGFIGCAKQRGFRWAIYTVENHVMWRKQSRWNRRRITRAHSERRGIDNKIDIRKLRAQCRFLPSRCFEARCGAKHTRSSKKRP